MKNRLFKQCGPGSIVSASVHPGPRESKTILAGHRAPANA